MVHLEHGVMLVTFDEGEENATQVFLANTAGHDCPIGFDMIIFHGPLREELAKLKSESDKDAFVEIETSITPVHLAPAVMIHLHDIYQVDFLMEILLKARQDMMKKIESN